MQRKSNNKNHEKALILLIALSISVFTNAQTGAPYSGFYEPTPVPNHPSNQNSIVDGWYVATIEYTSNTGLRATYTLNVAVEQLCVIAIDFGNGGSVHKDRNNSGYYYNGGGLYISRDNYGNVISASTTVRITYDNGSWQRFDIFIE